MLVCVLLQEQETLSFIRENLEKSDQLTKGMVGWKHTHTRTQNLVGGEKVVKSPFFPVFSNGRTVF